MFFYSLLGILFAFFAVIGGALFIARLIMQLFGIAGDTDIFHGTDGHTHIGDSDVSFKLLSLQGLTAFLTMFGLVGLAMEQAHTGNMLAVLGATSAGMLSFLTLPPSQRVGIGKKSKERSAELSNRQAWTQSTSAAIHSGTPPLRIWFRVMWIYPPFNAFPAIAACKWSSHILSRTKNI